MLAIFGYLPTDILVPLDNYISRGTDHFLACKDPDYQQSLWKALQSVSLGLTDCSILPLAYDVLGDTSGTTFAEKHRCLQIMMDENMEDSDIEPAPKLIEVVFQNCKGNVDQWVEHYLRITIARLRRAQKPYLKCLLVQVVRCYMNTSIYNFIF